MPLRVFKNRRGFFKPSSARVFKNPLRAFESCCAIFLDSGRFMLGLGNRANSVGA